MVTSNRYLAPPPSQAKSTFDFIHHNGTTGNGIVTHENYVKGNIDFVN